MKDNLFTRLFKPKTKYISHDDTGRELGHGVSGWPSFTTDSDAYENVYSSVRPIASKFSTFLPYAKDAKNKTVELSVVNAIYHPNRQMGLTTFLDTLAVGVLTQPEVNLLVWTKQGAGVNIKPDNIIGYTFLPTASKDVFGNKQWEVRNKDGSVHQYDENQVITIVHSRNPGDLSKGYSPTQAAKRWTTIDDFIADYQAGFFANNAVPAGMFQITAPTKREYTDIVKHMKSYHQGAKNNGGVIYSYQPIDPSTNKPAQAGITWIPFNVSNKDLELGVLFENTNQKIDSSFGVSAIIRGVDDQATYANAEVAKKNFYELVLEPFTRSIWLQFTHELNRITGGIGAVITVDIDIPAVSDELKIKAETTNIQLNTLILAINSGFALDSAVRALNLPDDFKLLTEKPKPEQEEELQSIDEGEEVNNAPDQDYEDTGGEIAYAKSKKKDSCDHDTKQITTAEQDSYALQMEVPTRKLMESQINRAILQTDTKAIKAVDDNIGEPTEEDEQEWTAAMLAIITSAMVISGAQQWREGREMLVAAGVTNIPSDIYGLSQSAVDRYSEYLKTVFSSYTDDTSQRIREVLLDARTNNLTRAEIENNLRGIINTDAYRVTRIGVTETNRSLGLSNVEAMIKIQEDSGVVVEKALMSTTGNPCQYCQQFINQWIPVESVMLEKGATVTGADGGTFVNTWTDNYGTDVHANGHCRSQYRVVR